MHANTPPQLPLQYPFRNITLPENTSQSIYEILNGNNNTNGFIFFLNIFFLKKGACLTYNWQSNMNVVA